MRCEECDEDFGTPQQLAGHRRSQKHINTIMQLSDADGVRRISTAFKNRIASYAIQAAEGCDIPAFLKDCEGRFLRLVGAHQHSTQKINIELFGHYTKPEDDESDLKSFNTRFVEVIPSDDLMEVYSRLCNVVKTKSEEFQVSFSKF